MLNRQDSLLSSSSRRQTTPPPENHRRKRSVGCMAGIFHLISKYQTKTKRLTSGRKRGKFSEDSSPATQDDDQSKVTVERSPALRPELRRNHPAENAKTQPALVARLMGLEPEKCSPAEAVTVVEGESLTEVKRKMLLQALDKCNQDLEALKKIIKAVESAPPVPAAANGGGSTPPAAVDKVVSVDHQVLSPISVLDERMVTRSWPLTRIYDNNAEQKKQAGKKADESMNCFLKKFKTKSDDTSVASQVMWCSKAMVQSVEEVCRDLAWGEDREAGKIGLVLQDYICADLIQELVKDMESSFPCIVSLPFEACRRRLCL